MAKYGTLRDLLSRINYSVKNHDQKPICLLAGSGISAGVVPGTTATIHVARKAVSEDERIEFDEILNVHPTPGLKYQAAFDFLSKRLPPAERDKIIRAITLRAYKSDETNTHKLPEDRLIDIEGDVGHWTIPLGTEAIGRIWAGLPVEKRGPIITTNFDPLLEVSLKKAGANIVPQIVDADGNFRSSGTYSDVTQVFHIHGLWRDSTTLSMTSQLTKPRPGLAGSLRELLRTHTLLVVGYSGWQDALMTELQKVVDEQTYRDLDVLWCYFNDEADLEKEISENSALFSLTKAAGNVQFYTGIDANKAFPEIEKHIAGFLQYDDRAREVTRDATPANWLRITSSISNTLNATQKTYRALEFFDGRIPSVGDGFNNSIPKLDIVATISNEVRAKSRARKSSLTLLVGPSGEGKSMALIQIAASIADSKSNAIVYYSKDGALDSAVDFIKIERTQPSVLIVDNAQNGAGALRDMVRAINDEAMMDLHLVVGVRDTDWSSVGGQVYAWRNYIDFKIHKIHGISRVDAASLVTGWEAIGERALGSLSEIEGTEARIEKLLETSRDPRVSGDGSLFGALLATRHGDGLKEHVRQLLLTLEDRLIGGLHHTNRDSLLFAFACIAIPHSLGFTGVSRYLLSRVLGISRGALEANVIAPLCDEAAITADTDRLATRHILIARAVVDVLDDISFDARDAIKLIVMESVRFLESGASADDALELAYMSRRLSNRRDAVFAAECAVEASPHRMSYKTSLSRALRFDNRVFDAAAVCRESIRSSAHSPDRSSGLRVAAVEWAVCEGQMRHYKRNAFLAGWGAGSWRGSTPLKAEQVSVALNCLVVALTRLVNECEGDASPQALSSALLLLKILAFDSSSDGVIIAAEEALESCQFSPIEDVELATQVLTLYIQGLRSDLSDEADVSVVIPRFDFSDLNDLALNEEQRQVSY